MLRYVVLEIARMHHTICRLEHELAETRCAEGQGLVKLYKHWAEDAKKQQDYAEFDLCRSRPRHGDQQLQFFRVVDYTQAKHETFPLLQPK